MTRFSILSGRYFSLFGLLFIFLSVTDIHAERIGADIALRVATRFVEHFSPLRKSPVLHLVYTGTKDISFPLRSSDDEGLLYIYNVGDNEGFVIVSGDDCVQPILGYSTEGYFGADRMPDNLKNWLRNYEKEIEAVRSGEYIVSGEAKKIWADLLESVNTKLANGFTLQTALWDQGEPYNSLCPLNQRKQTYTGCVATAMGIAMKYYKWPEKGKGEHAYETRTDGIPLSASFDVAYDWGNMLESYTKRQQTPQWSALQGEAVATLMYHCGVATEMDYGTESSGAYSTDAVKALITYFGYDNGMYQLYRDIYSANDWHERIRKELDERRIVLYDGQTKDEEGHMFLIDGYTESDYFHVNWGWSGLANGYYLLSSLDPDLQGIGGSKSGAGYSNNQSAIVGMQKAKKDSEPNYEVFFYRVKGPRSPYGLYTDVQKVEKNKPFRLYFSQVFNFGFRTLQGPLGVFLEDKNSVVKDTLCLIDLGEGLPGNYMIWEPNGIRMNIRTEIEEGDRMQMYYSTGDDKWKAVRNEPGYATTVNVYNDNTTSNPTIHNKETGVRVFPGTVESEVTVTSASGYIAQVSLFDLSGRLAKDYYSGRQEISVTLTLSDLPSGVYIVSVRTSEGYSRHKIVKK